MLKTTEQALSAILASDPSVTPDQRKAFLGFLKSPAASKAVNEIPRVIRRKEAARILGVSPKRCDQWAASGALKRVTPPGMFRCIGFTEASVRAIAEGTGEAA